MRFTLRLLGKHTSSLLKVSTTIPKDLLELYQRRSRCIVCVDKKLLNPTGSTTKVQTASDVGQPNVELLSFLLIYLYRKHPYIKSSFFTLQMYTFSSIESQRRLLGYLPLWKRYAGVQHRASISFYDNNLFSTRPRFFRSVFITGFIGILGCTFMLCSCMTYGCDVSLVHRHHRSRKRHASSLLKGSTTIPKDLLELYQR
uniref:Uncharacterized protein n=1 Tax=Lactuca sativa TaxID=4236 RepID=A0A9R1VLP9_LACSA|nr:hypothetical protein LSAT_V11C500296080 [Lactuca sativa]